MDPEDLAALRLAVIASEEVEAEDAAIRREGAEDMALAEHLSEEEKSAVVRDKEALQAGERQSLRHLEREAASRRAKWAKFELARERDAAEQAEREAERRAIAAERTLELSDARRKEVLAREAEERRRHRDVLMEEKASFRLASELQARADEEARTEENALLEIKL